MIYADKEDGIMPIRVVRKERTKLCSVEIGQVRGDKNGNIVFVSTDGNGITGETRYTYVNREPYRSFIDSAEGIEEKFPIIYSATLTVE